MVGAPLGQYSYKPYGKLLSSSTPVSGNPFTYTAREDDGTGLYYYRARYYDPTLELFISQDPLGDAQRYVAGNPLKYKDPLGLVDILVNDRGFGHTAILAESVTGDNDRAVYQTGSGDNIDILTGYGKSTYKKTLGDFSNPPFGSHDWIVELDPKVFGRDGDFINSKTMEVPIYTLVTLGNPRGNCSGYVGSVLNHGLKSKGLPELVNTSTPAMLLRELYQRGYITRVRIYR